MDTLDASLGKVVRKERWRRIDLGAFKAHEFCPVNSDLVGMHALTGHPRRRVKGFGRTTSIFLGLHPRKAQVPPNGRESITATDRPAARQRNATMEAAEPVPMMTKS